MLNIILLLSKITHAETPLENLCYIFITIITIITKYGLPVTK